MTHHATTSSDPAVDLFKKSVNEAWEAAWDRGEVDALDAITHPEYALENAHSGVTTGLDVLKREVLEMRQSFPDLRTTIDKLIVEGDDFALFWTSTGTFSAALGDVPATGRAVRTRGSIQGVLRAGKIARERVTWDRSELLKDLGAPPLGSAFEPVDPDGDAIVEMLDPALQREFNRRFITGVTVVTTTLADGTPRGLAVNAYASVSLEPPLVLVCVQKTSSTYPALFQADRLGINILGNSQHDVVTTFASKSNDKFSALTWHRGPGGSPLIDGSTASVEAIIKERFQAKTHTVFVARVTHIEVSDVAPMVYSAGRFFDGATLAEL